MRFWGRGVRFIADMIHEERTYRSLINKDNLISYRVKISQSDLWISSDSNLASVAEKSLLKHRFSLESYIDRHPEFQTALLPYPQDFLAPGIVREMIARSAVCGVGPMASVAGAIAEFVGNDLSGLTDHLIIENGGDIFLLSKSSLTIGIFAGESTLSYKVKIIVKPEETPLGVCTSSATVGPSLSFGKADAFCVLSSSPTLAVAAASAIGNRVNTRYDIRNAMNCGMKIPGVKGIVIIFGNEMGAMGEVELA